MRVVSEIDDPSMFIQGSGVDDGLRTGGGGLYFSHKTCSLSDLFIQYPTTSSQKALAHVLAGKMAISNKQSAISNQQSTRHKAKASLCLTWPCGVLLRGQLQN